MVKCRIIRKIVFVLGDNCQIIDTLIWLMPPCRMVTKGKKTNHSLDAKHEQMYSIALVERFFHQIRISKRFYSHRKNPRIHDSLHRQEFYHRLFLKYLLGFTFEPTQNQCTKNHVNLAYSHWCELKIGWQISQS